MTKLRQDAWSHEEDLLLKDIVLDYIQSGLTQLEAFDLVAKEVHRTPAACGFRWNKELRHQYKTEISEAKQVRHKKLNNKNKTLAGLKNSQTTQVPSAIEKTFETISKHVAKQEKQISKQLHHIDALTKEKEKLLQTIHQLETKLATVEKDYHTFISIMERARKMVVLEQPEQQSFTMDKNGNLEFIAK